jgi:hypothetical protein
LSAEEAAVLALLQQRMELELAGDGRSKRRASRRNAGSAKTGAHARRARKH